MLNRFLLNLCQLVFLLVYSTGKTDLLGLKLLLEGTFTMPSKTFYNSWAKQLFCIKCWLALYINFWVCTTSLKKLKQLNFQKWSFNNFLILLCSTMQWLSHTYTIVYILHLKWVLYMHHSSENCNHALIILPQKSIAIAYAYSYITHMHTYIL